MLTTRQFSSFLKSSQAKVTAAEKMAQETTGAVKSTEGAVNKTTEAIAKAEEAIKETKEAIVQQAQTLSGFTIVTTAFLPLGFCTSVFSPLLLVRDVSIFFLTKENKFFFLVLRNEQYKGIRQRPHVQTRFLARHVPCTRWDTATNGNSHPLEASMGDKT